jgi:serine/threonine protein kinase
MKKQNLEIVFAMQIAQALCVFTKHGFIHNDLHLGNIFVVVHSHPITFEYDIPFKFKITTQYELVIYDYDFASSKNIKNSSGDGIHLQVFKYNWDWYMFLTYFIFSIQETNKKSKLKRFFPNIFETSPSQEIGKNVYFGYACKCVTLDEETKNCTRCEYDDETLQNLPSPLSFLEFCIKDKNRQKKY